MNRYLMVLESVELDLSRECNAAMIRDVVKTYMGAADHEYWDLFGAWIGGGPL